MTKRFIDQTEKESVEETGAAHNKNVGSFIGGLARGR